MLNVSLLQSSGSKRGMIISDSSFIDMSGAGEHTHIMNDAVSIIGDTLDQVTSIDSTATPLLQSLSVGTHSFLLVPELEKGNLYQSLSASDTSAIRNYVEMGGKLIVSNDASGRGLELLNGLFGWSILIGSRSSSSTPLNTAAAAGTSFALGPATLSYASGLYVASLSTLPSNTDVMYSYQDEAWVFRAKYGYGSVIFLGFDWYASSRTQWYQVLSNALSYRPGMSLPLSIPATSKCAMATNSLVCILVSWKWIPDIGLMIDMHAYTKSAQ